MAIDYAGVASSGYNAYGIDALVSSTGAQTGMRVKYGRMPFSIPELLSIDWLIVLVGLAVALIAFRSLGDCGCHDGGAAESACIFGESYASCGKVANVIPVDVAVPGCPPTPLALMQGILTAICGGKA